MKISAAGLFTVLVVLSAFAASAAAAAEVYKWTDKDGKVHYSERRPAAAGGKAVDIKLTSPPPQTVSPATMNASSSPETAAPGAAVKRREEVGQGPSNSQPKSLSGGRIDETKESKCNLARDVLSGAVRHGNGAPTDAHDRQVAENDIRIFCSK